MPQRRILDEDELQAPPDLPGYFRFVGMMRIFTLSFIIFQWIYLFSFPATDGWGEFLGVSLGILILFSFFGMATYYNIIQAGLELRLSHTARKARKYRVLSTFVLGVLSMFYLRYNIDFSFSVKSLLHLSLPTIVFIVLVVIVLTDLRYLRHESSAPSAHTD
ncbi:MAG: hypothetical protein AAF990_15565 [Bacteroidota bacterium]